MTDSSYGQRVEGNGLALVSLVSGIVGWVLFLALLCLNFFILPFLVVATLGVGLIVYICLLPTLCLSPIAWIIAIITGHTSLNQIQISGQSGEGMAKAGLIMSYIGLGLMLLSICGLVLLGITGVSIPLLDQILYQFRIF